MPTDAFDFTPSNETAFVFPSIDFLSARIERSPLSQRDTEPDRALYQLVVPGSLSPGWMVPCLADAFRGDDGSQNYDGPRGPGGLPAELILGEEGQVQSGAGIPLHGFELRFRIRRDALENISAGEIRGEIQTRFDQAASRAEALHEQDAELRAHLASDWLNPVFPDDPAVDAGRPS